jgi:dihydrofolate reductase
LQGERAINRGMHTDKPDTPEKIIIAAVAENGVIGHAGKIPWDLPAEQRLFRKLTLGHTLIMGRRTFESIGRPLEGRHNIVVSRTLQPVPGLMVQPRFDAALKTAEGIGRPIFFLGGVEIYRQALKVADRMLLSRIPGRFPGDTYFPPIPPGQWEQVAERDYGSFILQTYRPAVRKSHT